RIEKIQLIKRQQNILKTLEALSEKLQVKEKEYLCPTTLPSPPPSFVNTPATLQVWKACEQLNLTSARFLEVDPGYYGLNLGQRRQVLGAQSIHQLCKTIIIENGRCTNHDCSDPLNSLYYAVVIQYTTRLQCHKIFHFVRELNEHRISAKNFKFRLAPTNVSNNIITLSITFY